MVKYLYDRVLSSMWLRSSTKNPSHSPTSDFDRSPYDGVLLRQTRGMYVTQPSQLAGSLVETVQRLNPAVAFTMSTDITNMIFSILSPTQREIVLPSDGSQYQILDSFEEMANATSGQIKKFQYACFVRREGVLLLWHDDVERILVHAAEVERKLLTVVSHPVEAFSIVKTDGQSIQIWGNTVPALPSQGGSRYSSALPTPGVTSPADSTTAFPYFPPSNDPEKTQDVEALAKPASESMDRPLIFVSAIFVGMGVCLIMILLLGFGVSEVNFLKCRCFRGFFQLTQVSSYTKVWLMVIG